MPGEVCQHTVTDKDGQTFVCGQIHDPAKCRAHVKDRERGADGRRDRSQPVIGVRPCKKGPMNGQKVCDLHGGRSPQAKARAEVRMAEEAVAKAVVTFGLPREIDPRDALLEEVYRTAGAVDWLHRQVQALAPDDVIWGKTEQVDKTATEFAGMDTTHKAVVHVWVALWQEERRHFVAVSKAAIAAGIEERKVRLAEQQGALLADVIQAILGDLDLTPQQQKRVATVVPLHLRAIQGGRAV